MAIFRGEVYFVQLGPTVGREIDSKRRPVAVLSIDSINSKPLVVLVVPGTTWTTGKRLFANEVKIDPTATNGLSSPTLFQCHQLKAIDHSRFDQAAKGMLTSQDLARIETAAKFCLGFS